jgi:hypothetical protein
MAPIIDAKTTRVYMLFGGTAKLLLKKLMEPGKYKLAQKNNRYRMILLLGHI